MEVFSTTVNVGGNLEPVSFGVKPKTIQVILRHSDIGTSLSYYVEVPESEPAKLLKP